MKPLQIFLLAFLFLGVTSKYSSEPKYTFNGGFTSSSPPYYMVLSDDSDRLGLASNLSTSYNKQTIFNLDGGSINCISSNVSITYIPQGFPAQTSMVYVDLLTARFMKMASCGAAVPVANISSGLTAFGIGSTSKESFLALAYNNTIVEYNIGSSSQNKIYSLNLGERIWFLYYSVERDMLWVGVASNGIYKAVSFDTSSGSRKNDYVIEGSLGFVKGNNDGDGFIGYSTTFGIYYKFDKNGNRKAILTPNSATEIVIGVCTSNDLLISLKGSTGAFKFVAYDSDDGSEVQSFDLSFIPAQFRNTNQIIACNDNYIAFVDIQGNFRVFDYTHPFPVWAIIVIVIGGVLIIGGAVGFYIWRKKKMQRAQNQGYQPFNNQGYQN